MDFSAGKIVVQLWDSFGLGLDFEDDEDEYTLYDLRPIINLILFNLGKYYVYVIERLNSLRGKGMVASYSWSSKWSYKNGFVWHDLADNDYIFPVHSQEYVLKGSEIVVVGEAPLNSRSEAQNSPSPEFGKAKGNGFLAVRHRRNQSWSAHEYKVYTDVSSVRTDVADAPTLTDENGIVGEK